MMTTVTATWARWRPVVADPTFVRLWTATTSSRLATWLLPFVLGFAVVDRTLGSAELGTILAARTVGFLLAVTAGGVLADRYSPRAVVLVAGLAAATATPVIAAGLSRSVLLMVAAAVVVGAGQGACRPAFQALVADVVEPGRRQLANAAILVAVEGTGLAAPGIAAALNAVFDVSVLVVGTGVLWLMAAVAAPRGGPGPTVRPGSSSFVGDLVEGVREARRHAWYVASLLALTAVITTGYSVTGVVLPLVSRDRYGSEAVFAAAMTALTAGSLIGSLVATRSRRSPGWVGLAGLSCYSLGPLSLLLPVPGAVVAAAYAVVGAGYALFGVRWFTAEQHEIDRAVLARVSSIGFLTAYGLAPVGLAAIGPAIDAVSQSGVLVACALTCALAPAAAALAPGARTFSRPVDPPPADSHA
jgi:MFS family permease